MSERPARRIRILHCVGGLELGGEQRYLAQIANRIDPLRFEQAIAFSGVDASEQFHLARHIRLIRVLPSKLTLRRIAEWPTVWDYVRLVRAENPDVLTTHSPGAWHLCASATARLMGKPVVHTIQRPYGNRTTTEDVAIRFWPLRKLSYAVSSRFVALGSYYAEDQAKRWHIPARKIDTNYIGIDLEEHRPNETLRAEGRGLLALTGPGPVFGTVARLVPIKGVDRGINLFAAIRKHLPQAQLVVVGGGPSRDELEAQARSLGVGDAVTFTGTRPDTPTLLNAFDVFLQTTHNPLNGISSIEAMAVGRPVVTVVDGEDEEEMARDTCVESANGLFGRMWDLEASAAKIAALLGNAETRARMGLESRKMAEARFDIAAHVRRLEDMYVALVGSR